MALESLDDKYAEMFAAYPKRKTSRVGFAKLRGIPGSLH
jgi:hypothetical protein